MPDINWARTKRCSLRGDLNFLAVQKPFESHLSQVPYMCGLKGPCESSSQGLSGYQS